MSFVQRYEPHSGKNALSRNVEESVKKFLDAGPEADDFQNGRTLNTLNVTTALTSCSFVNALFVNDNDNANFHYNPADAHLTEEKHGPYVQTQ